MRSRDFHTKTVQCEVFLFLAAVCTDGRSQGPRGIRVGSAATRFAEIAGSNAVGCVISVSYLCCVLSDVSATS